MTAVSRSRSSALLLIWLALALGAGNGLAQPVGQSTQWTIPAGEVRGPALVDTSINLFNSSAFDGQAKVTLAFEDGTVAEQVYSVPAHNRLDLSVAREFPFSTGAFSAVVESVGSPAAELVVEWEKYAIAPTMVWAPSLGTSRNALSQPVANAVHVDSASPGTTTAAIIASIPATTTPGAVTYNLKVISDASPDLSDMNSLIRSATSLWTTDQDKVWALFYWSHILKRQTAPMVLHGFEVTDPIRNFADYGFTMCSTISGINQSLYEALGLRHQYWDICNHTVASVEYGGTFHMVDSSMSNLVTTDDGVTLASVQQAAADSARLVRERSLYSSSPNGFLTGSDMMRNLPDAVSPSNGSVTLGFARSFCADGLKFRDYFYNWDQGHRLVFNLRQGESYTRYYRRLGATPDYWVGSERIAAPDPAQTYEIDSANAFGLRGNGRWMFSPRLSEDAWARAAYRSSNITAASGGLKPAAAGQDADAVYKVQAANAIASQLIDARFARPDALATATMAVSLNHGATWTDVATIGSAVGPDVPVAIQLRNEVNGAYETLIRIRMRATSGSPDGIVLTALTIDTITQVNAKALPALNIGRNEIFVGVGEQSDTMVLWPDLRGDLWKRDVYDFKNIATQSVSVPRKYTAVAYPAVLSQDAWLTYRMEAPTDITRVVYGGRLHNFRAGSFIDFLHSFDNGVTWVHSYRLSDVSKPYDDIHHETVTGIPAGVRTVLFKFLIHNLEPTVGRATGLYSVRMEVSHRGVNEGTPPLDVTLRWKEIRTDRTVVERSHKQRIDGFPFKYAVNVGGSDHPIMESMKVNVADDGDVTPLGYGDGLDVGGQKYVHRTRVEGTNLAKDRPYAYSRQPSGFQYSAPAGNTTILTDGVVGAPTTGGISYWWGQCWSANTNVDLLVDLGATRTVGAFRAHLFGSPFWDALKGQVQDRVEIMTSTDGVNFASQGLLTTSLWKKDLPINYMILDQEKATAWNFALTLPAQVLARYVRYRVTPLRILCASELQVFDRIDDAPFDIRIALPDAAEPPPPPPPPPPGTPIDEIVMYVAADSRITGGWVITSDATAAGGARLQNADAGAAKLAAPLAAPAQSFDLTFDAEAGKPYRLWLRGKAQNNSYANDSVFVQFDGSVDANGAPIWRIGTTSATIVVLEDCSGCGVQGWGWADNGYGANALGPIALFASSGPQRLRIQVREDGLGIDQVVLSAVKYLNARPGATENDSVILPK